MVNLEIWSKELTTSVFLLGFRLWPFTMHLEGRNFKRTLKTFNIRRTREQIKQIYLKFSPSHYSIEIFLKHLNLQREQPPNLAVKSQWMSDSRYSKLEEAKHWAQVGGTKVNAATRPYKIQNRPGKNAHGCVDHAPLQLQKKRDRSFYPSWELRMYFLRG